MKFTLDKNFLLVQVAIVVIFYLLNTWLANKDKSKHFNAKDSISPFDMFTYVSGLQFGAPGSKLEPVSSEAKVVALLQRIMFIAMAFGALTYVKSDSSLTVPGFGFANPVKSE